MLYVQIPMAVILALVNLDIVIIVKLLVAAFATVVLLAYDR